MIKQLNMAAGIKVIKYWAFVHCLLLITMQALRISQYLKSLANSE